MAHQLLLHFEWQVEFRQACSVGVPEGMPAQLQQADLRSRLVEMTLTHRLRVVRLDDITKEWKEAGSFAAHLNLYGFWDEHAFLTKSGDLGAVLRIGGIDYESLDHAGRDYAVKRLEAALRSLDDRCRLYQILFKRNRPAIPDAEYENPLVRAAVEQRSAFLASKADSLYSIEIFWIVMVDGSYQKTGLLHALAGLPKQPRASHMIGPLVAGIPEGGGLLGCEVPSLRFGDLVQLLLPLV